MDELSELFTITCGHCHKTNTLDDWVKDMPRSTHKCPACGYTFIRKLVKDRYQMDVIVLERILI